MSSEAVMPPISLYVRAMVILPVLALLCLVALARPAWSADTAPTIQNQPQINVPPLKQATEGKPVLELPRKGPQLRADRDLSREIDEELGRDQLPSVKAQVFKNVDDTKSVVLTGQVRDELGKKKAERTVRDLLEGSTVVITNQIKINPGLVWPAPPLIASQTTPSHNELEIPQVGFMSKELLGCWTGTTASSPAKWETLSPMGAYLGYHSDRLGLCLTLRDGKLEVTDASANNVQRGREMYGFVYKLVSANGKEIDLELKSWDLTDPNGYVAKGTGHCTLNSDDTVAYVIDVTTFLKGQAALRTATTARLEREH
ncbi:MAG: BON domain-containing protein [Candidatus Binataceae bacterium]|jgi:hypothetical protein